MKAELLEGAVLYPEVDEAALFREREKQRDRFICRYAQKLRQRGETTRAEEIHSSSGPHECVPPEELNDDGPRSVEVPDVQAASHCPAGAWRAAL